MSCAVVILTGRNRIRFSLGKGLIWYNNAKSAIQMDYV